MFSGRKLPLTLVFVVLVAVTTGVSCKGFFTNPTLSSITINPTSPSVQLGQSVTLRVWGVYSDNTGNYLTSGVSWSSETPTVAQITGACANGNPCGTVTIEGLTAGTSTISAGSQNATNTATLTVFINVSSMSISPQSQSVTGLTATTPAPYIVTANGSTDISSGATLTASLNGTTVTSITCAYSSTSPAGIYCTGDGTETSGTKYTLVATYPGTNVTATAFVTFN